MDAFHAAYKQGRWAAPPDEYTTLILVPALLHIDPLEFDRYPLLLQERIKMLLHVYIREGWGGKPEMIDRG